MGKDCETCKHGAPVFGALDGDFLYCRLTARDEGGGITSWALANHERREGSGCGPEGNKHEQKQTKS